MSLVGDAVGGLGAAAAERAAFAVGAGVCAVAGAGFLVAAAYTALAREFDPLTAMLLCGAALLVLAWGVFAYGGRIARRKREEASRAGAALRDQMGVATALVASRGLRWAPLAAAAAGYAMARRR
jgi:hypothetical protein